MKTKTPKARVWAYITLGVGLVASVAGNVANTVLVDSLVPLGLRVPFAVIWPVLTYLAIEVLTRTPWKAGFAHVATRVFLAGPVALVAAFVSYLHLHHLMVMAGEPGLAQAVGPIGIDGALFGATVVLLITRPDMVPGESRTLVQRVQDLKATVTETLDAVKAPAVPAADPIGAVPAPSMSDVDLGPEAPEVLTQEDPEPEAPKTRRVPAQRQGSWDVAKAVQMILENQKDLDVAAAVGIGPKMIQRTRRAVFAVKADPTADIPQTWKVPADVVRVIRDEVRKL